MLANLKVFWGVYFQVASYSPNDNRLEDAVMKINKRRESAGVKKVSSTKVKIMCETRWVERYTVLAPLY